MPIRGCRRLACASCFPLARCAAISAARSPREDEYHAHRIALGVPEGGRDYAFGDAFPHEAMFDQLAGVDFNKGCFVGQEVVSRMEHRGTARKRIVGVEGRDLCRPQAPRSRPAAHRSARSARSAAARGLRFCVSTAPRRRKPPACLLRAGEVTVALRIPAWARLAAPVAGSLA